jgi:hypothetical protein
MVSSRCPHIVRRWLESLLDLRVSSAIVKRRALFTAVRALAIRTHAIVSDDTRCPNGGLVHEVTYPASGTRIDLETSETV